MLTDCVDSVEAGKPNASIDILLPYYGDVGLMQVAVDSVRGQHDTDWTMYVVDDNYPDPTVAEWFSTRDDPRIHYQRNATNLGANGNYRRALELATADYVVVMGADDVMLPGYVARLRSLIAGWPRAGVFQPGVEIIDEHGETASPLADRVKARLAPSASGVVELVGEDLARSVLRGNWTYFPSLCWDRRLIQETGFRRGLDVVQDLALILDVAHRGRSLVVDPTVVFQYRRHLSSDSAVRAVAGSRFREERDFFRTAATQCREAGWNRAARAARWHLTSRLNAASLLPRAVGARKGGAVRTLLAHTLVP